jgi:hypothetical protein
MLTYAECIDYYKDFQVHLMTETPVIFSFLSSERIQCYFEGRQTVGVLRLCNNGKDDTSAAFKVEDGNSVNLTKCFVVKTFHWLWFHMEHQTL